MNGSVKDVGELVDQARKHCHDLNQPLTVIMARSELMLLKMSPDDPNHKNLEQIHDQALKVSQLVSSLQTMLREFQEG